MDLQKAQILSQHINRICDMVKYIEVGDYIVNAGAISVEENQVLQRKLDTNGNIMVMHELLAILTVRRGGFDAFVNALRKSDYIWLADYLDVGKISAEPQPEANLSAQSMIKSVRNRLSRKSESLISTQSSEDIFMSYRDECSLDIPINPSYYASPRTSSVETEETIQLDSSSLFPVTGIPKGQETNQESQKPKVSSLLKRLHLIDSDSTGTLPSSNTQAVIYICSGNIPNENAEEYFTTLAKRASVPSPMVKGLKVLRSGKIRKRHGKKNKLKLQFSSEMGRNTFVENLNQFIANVNPSDELYESVSHMKVSVSRKKNAFKNSFKLKSKGIQEGQSATQSVSFADNKNESVAEQKSKNWYHKPFL